MECVQNLARLHTVSDFIDLQIRFSRKCIVERMAWFQSYRDHDAVRRKLSSAAGPVIHSAYALICDLRHPQSRNDRDPVSSDLFIIGDNIGHGAVGHDRVLHLHNGHFMALFGQIDGSLRANHSAAHDHDLSANLRMAVQDGEGIDHIFPIDSRNRRDHGFGSDR